MQVISPLKYLGIEWSRRTSLSDCSGGAGAASWKHGSVVDTEGDLKAAAVLVRPGYGPCDIPLSSRPLMLVSTVGPAIRGEHS